jgi:formate hydrogenlyase subunit 3/multisubunit Na+/H+ antiporter MnhD subunit
VPLRNGVTLGTVLILMAVDMVCDYFARWKIIYWMSIIYSLLILNNYRENTGLFWKPSGRSFVPLAIFLGVVPYLTYKWLKADQVSVLFIIILNICLLLLMLYKYDFWNVK